MSALRMSSSSSSHKTKTPDIAYYTCISGDFYQLILLIFLLPIPIIATASWTIDAS